MSQPVDRRRFLEIGTTASVALGAYAAVSGAQEKASANEKIVIGVMGVNGRGSSLAKGFAQQTNAEIAYICDVDQRAVAKGPYPL